MSAPRKTNAHATGRPCGMPVIGWKYPPSAWWPELPGKATPRGWTPAWKPQVDSQGEVTWVKRDGVVSSRRVCLECRRSNVYGLQKYCSRCAATRKRASNRRAVQKLRVSVRKTGFSPIHAEALTDTQMLPATTIAKCALHTGGINGA